MAAHAFDHCNPPTNSNRSKAIETKFRIAKSRNPKIYNLLIIRNNMRPYFFVAAHENDDVLSPAPPLRQ